MKKKKKSKLSIHPLYRKWTCLGSAEEEATENFGLTQALSVNCISVIYVLLVCFVYSFCFV